MDQAEQPALIQVLLIEDNPLDAILIDAMVKDAGRNGFMLERTDRLATGLARLAKGDIHLVLLDLSLPDSHGLDTFARLHSQVPHMPIIVMSGLDDETVAVSAVQQGAQDYLVKGHVDGHLLVRAMRYAIERKRTAEQLARYASELHEKNRQMEADLVMAREIQQVFLPQQYPTFPHSATPEQSAVRFYHRYQPAAAVGGDFFNVLPISDTEAGIFICDVMGHGLRAALVTAIFRGLVEELMPVAADAGRFLTEINRRQQAILRRPDEPMLATAFYLVADLAKGEARYASAGHPSPLRLQREARVAVPLSDHDPRHGPALGLFEDATYPTCHIPVLTGDVIVWFTDGLYEVEGAGQEDFGMERLLAAVHKRIHLPTPTLFDELLAETRSFSLQKEFADDVCLVGMEIVRLGIEGEDITLDRAVHEAQTS
jgi:sigma-B regulation protein RsbU (phosphoserine phosphatase)